MISDQLKNQMLRRSEGVGTQIMGIENSNVQTAVNRNLWDSAVRADFVLHVGIGLRMNGVKLFT